MMFCHDKGRRTGVASAGRTIYPLFQDGWQEISPVREEIEQHDGIFGIKADAWSAICWKRTKSIWKMSMPPGRCTDADKPGSRLCACLMRASRFILSALVHGRFLSQGVKKSSREVTISDCPGRFGKGQAESNGKQRKSTR